MKQGYLNYKNFVTIFLTVVAVIMLQGCLGLLMKPKENAKPAVVVLKLSADSGFVTKSQVLPFLIANGLTDTLNDWWKKWTPADTMGKYYKMEDGDKYLLCVLSADNDQTVAINKLLEIDKDGKMTASQEFSCDWCDFDKRKDALRKRGKYFMTYSCGHGSSFSSGWFTLFKSIADKETQSQIMESQFVGAPQCQTIYSNWRLMGDTCIVNYTIENSKVTPNGCVPSDTIRTSILYHLKNGEWCAADSNKLKQMHIAQ